MNTRYLRIFAVMTLSLALACTGLAQDSSSSQTKDTKPATDQAPAQAPAPAAAPAEPPAAPAPLPTPSTVGPLQLAPPTNFEAGKLGKYSFNGAATAFGLFQNNAVP